MSKNLSEKIKFWDNARSNFSITSILQFVLFWISYTIYGCPNYIIYGLAVLFISLTWVANGFYYHYRNLEKKKSIDNLENS